MVSLEEKNQALPQDSNAASDASKGTSVPSDSNGNAFNGCLGIIAGAVAFAGGCIVAVSDDQPLSRAFGMFFIAVVCVAAALHTFRKSGSSG
ncbi:MAG: hypothetical protein RLZZ436_4493 [Planctomycetota bacterium]|jgi:hypothetical protein